MQAKRQITRSHCDACARLGASTVSYAVRYIIMSLGRIRDYAGIRSRQRYASRASRCIAMHRSCFERHDPVAASLAVLVRKNLRHSTHICARVFHLDPHHWPHHAVLRLVAPRRRPFGRFLVLIHQSFLRSYECRVADDRIVSDR